jgi:uncharacterized protein YqhQ
VIIISYEIIRLTRHRAHLRCSSAGLWLQRVTTQPPEDGMVECAITALDSPRSTHHGGEMVVAWVFRRASCI